MNAGIRGRGPRDGALLLSALLLASLVPGSLEAQEEPGPRQDRSCTLVLEPVESTRSYSRRVGGETYVTHVWGGMRWTCGAARMVADSAIKYDRQRRLKMIGSVDYEDSVRTLTSDTLTYHEGEDRIVAEGRVRLTRKRTGSTLRGPRVVFFRAAGGAPRRTEAYGRPHMVLRSAAAEESGRDTAAGRAGRPAAADDTGAAPGGAAAPGRDTVPAAGREPPEEVEDRGSPPVEVDADRALFLGDDEVRTWGDVRIHRGEVRARADSAFFWPEDGRGQLFGSPAVEGEAFTLAGDTIRLTFTSEQLRVVEAEGHARGSGQGFDLFAPRIHARLADEKVEALHAHGERRSAVLAPPYRLAGDSLSFGFAEGQLDSLVSVGSATAVETGEEPPNDPRAEIELGVEGDRSWVTGDTLHIAFAPSAAAPPADSVAAAPADTVAARPDTAGVVDGPGQGDAGGEGGEPPRGEDREIRSIRAVGNARAYYLVRDTAGTGAGQGGEDRSGPSRTYQLGREIAVFFEDGEARRVEGRQAIGVYLEPLAEGRPRGAPEAAPPVPDDTAADGAAPADTAGREAAPADSVGGPSAPPSPRGTR